MNTFGTTFRFTSFGESHGPAIGGVIDGCRAGLKIDFAAIDRELQRRKDGCAGISARAAAEEDRVEWLSGLLDGVTLGTPIAFVIRNTAAREEDYAELRDVFRPGHADEAYEKKYGIRDPRGGGRASARETAARVVAGAIAKQVLAAHGISVEARLVQVGDETDEKRFAETVGKAQQDGDSVGGVVECRITGVPAGMGEPLFGKVQCLLSSAIFSIPACRAFVFGHPDKLTSAAPDHIPFAAMRGSDNNRLSDGISGGITDGGDICFRAVFKPTPSISQMQTMRCKDGSVREVAIKGRHDACVAVRAVTVVEAMTALTLVNLL